MEHTREEYLETLISVGSLINSSLEPQEVCRRAVEAATSLLGAEAGSLFLVDQESGELFFEVALGEKGDEVRQFRLGRGEGIAGWVAERGEPLLINSPSTDPRFFHTMDTASGFSTRSILCVPVTVKGGLIGVLEVLNKRDGQFSADDQDILGSFAQQVAIALENARLYEENSRHLAALAAQERNYRLEKERLVRDLHDGLGGIASNIGLMAELARRRESLDEARELLVTIASLSREAVNELRSFMNTLEAQELRWQDLAAELRSRATDLLAPFGIESAFHVRLAAPEEELGMFLFLSLLRIAREALANVAKHAGARRAEISLEADADLCTLSISDDGRGLPPSPRLGRGLRSMKSRAAELNGDISISSPPGTRIKLTVPLPFVFPGSGRTGGNQ